MRYDQDKKELSGLNIHVKGIKGQSVVNIDSLKKSVAVFDKNFSIVSALYCKGDVCETLTGKDVNIDEIDRLSLVCKVKEDNTKPIATPTPTPPPTPTPSLTPVPSPTPVPSLTPTPTPTPTLTPTPSLTTVPNVTATKAIPSASASPVPTASPEPPKKTEKNNKYSYFKIACAVVAVIVATILIIKMARKCKGKTLARAGSDGEDSGSGSEELIQRPPTKDKNEVEPHDEEEAKKENEVADIEDVVDARVSAEGRPSSPEPAQDQFTLDYAQFEKIRNKFCFSKDLNLTECIELFNKIFCDGNFSRLNEKDIVLVGNIIWQNIDSFNEADFVVAVRLMKNLNLTKNEIFNGTLARIQYICGRHGLVFEELTLS
jgi:hypothetical protein